MKTILNPMHYAQNADAIAQNAVDIGTINPKAAEAASKAVRVGATNTGINVEELTGARVMLVNLVVDDSSSMDGTEHIVRDAIRQLKDELTLATNEGGCEVLICIYLLNKGLIQPYCRVAEAVDLHSGNHQNDGGTPMMGRTREVVGTLLAKISELAGDGRQVLSFTCLISDGAFTDVAREGTERTVDGHPGVPISEIHTLVTGLTDLETRQNIVCGVSIGGGASSMFEAIGIRSKWILNPGDGFAFAEAMKKVSRASKRASQGAFHNVAKEGFGKANEGFR